MQVMAAGRNDRLPWMQVATDPDRLGPQINEQLLQLDEKLARLWKPEAHPN